MVLLPENTDAGRIFYIVRYQLIMGPGGAIDVFHSAIRDSIREDREIPKNQRAECFDKVTNLIRRWWIPKLNERDEKP